MKHKISLYKVETYKINFRIKTCSNALSSGVNSENISIAEIVSI